MNILVSSCLIGVRCRYNGGGAVCEGITELKSRHNIIHICPEITGGLPTPRQPAEIKDGKVLTQDGRDVTAEYNKGADEALRLARLFSCTHAILKARSPSCGCGEIYDGTFSHALTQGDGITAELLKANGITVLNEENFEDELI